MKFVKCSICVFTVIVTGLLVAQPAFPLGTEFVACFEQTLSGIDIQLKIACDVYTNGTVTIPGLAYSQPFIVMAGSHTNVSLPLSAIVTGSDVIQDLGIRIEVDDPSAVYGFSERLAQDDAFTAIPLDKLGLEYIIASYYARSIESFPSQFAVVATEDNTIVVITPSSTNDSGKPPGVPYSVALNELQVYQLQASSAGEDLSGTVVLADKPVAVFGSHVSSAVPDPNLCCSDHLVEQLPPVSAWGTHFVTSPIATRSGDWFRVIASKDNTTITLPSGSPVVLNRGQVHEFGWSTGGIISSNAPVLVMQYIRSTYTDGVTNADPSMINVTPTDQFSDYYLIATPANVVPVHYLNVTALCSAAGSILLDGTPIPAGNFVSIGTSGYCYAQVSVGTVAHALSSPTPFGAYVYGFDYRESYGYPACVQQPRPCDDLIDVINTGWDETAQQLLNSGADDYDWLVIETPDGLVNQPVPAIVTNDPPDPSVPDSRWIGYPSSSTGGRYRFVHEFCIHPQFVGDFQLDVAPVKGNDSLWFYFNDYLVGPAGHQQPMTFTISHSWLLGTNRIEILLSTDFMGGGSAFCLSGTVSAEDGACCDSGACCACDDVTVPYCFYTDRDSCASIHGRFHPKVPCAFVDCDICYACGDANNNEVCMEPADFICLKNFLYHGGLAPDPLYQADLNCDGVVNSDDCDVYEAYFIYGFSALPCGYPAQTECCPTAEPAVPGDADGSGAVDIDDVVFLINYIFSGGPAPDPIELGDADCSENIDIDDVVYLISYIFAGGPPPGDPDNNGVPGC